MRLIIILVCFISFVVSRPQNSENNGYQYNIENQSKSVNNDRLSNLGLSQKLTKNLQSVTNNNYIPPLISGEQNHNNLPLTKTSGNIEITKSIGITSPSSQGDDNGFLNENKNILEQSGILNGIRNNNANHNIAAGTENNNIPTINLGSPTFSINNNNNNNNNYNPSIPQQQLNPIQPLQYSSNYQNYAPNYNSNGIISSSTSTQLRHQNDDIIEKNIYVHLPSSIEQYQPPPQHLPPRKHYKIIFVKAPNRPTPPPQPIQEIEEKTLVYVLVKKPDLPNLDELQAAHQQSIKSSKPEVYFIKYKTGQTEPGKIQSSLETELPSQIGNNNNNNGDSLIKNSINSSGLTSVTINDGNSSYQNQRLNDNRPQHLYDAPK